MKRRHDNSYDRQVTHNVPDIAKSWCRGISLNTVVLQHVNSYNRIFTKISRYHPIQSILKHFYRNCIKAYQNNQIASMSNDSTPKFLPDKNLDALAQAGGTDAAIKRGKWLAVGTILIGVIGAIGVGMRPVLRNSFAANAKKQAEITLAAKQAALKSRHDDARVRALLERLECLEARHRERHPMWYGLAPNTQQHAHRESQHMG